MTPLTLYNGKILAVNGKIAIDKSCCCDECIEECACGQTLTTNISNPRQLKVTLGNGSILNYCFNQLPKFQGGYVTEMTCNGCNYELTFYTGTCTHTVQLKISNPNQCDCDTTDYCELEIISWSDEPGCPPGGNIANLEFLDLCS